MFKKYIKFIVRYFKNSRLIIVLLQLSLLVMALMNMFLATLTQDIIDNVFINQTNSIYFYVLRMFIVISICYLFGIVGNYLNLKLLNEVDYKIKEEFFDKMQRSSYKFLKSIDASEIYYRMFGDINVFVNYAVKLFVTLPVQVCYIICILFKMSSWSFILTIYALVLVIIQIVNLIIFKKPITKAVTVKKETEQNIIYKVNEHFHKIEITKVFGIETHKLNEFKNSFNKVVRVNITNSFLITIFQSFTGIMNQVWYLGLLIISSVLISQNVITVGAFTGFYMLTNSLYGPTISAMETLMGYQECRISFQRFLEYYNNYDSSIYQGTQKLSKIENVAFLNISFNFNDKIIYKNASFKFAAGKMVLLMGESGIGKTTLFRMLAKLVNPSSGVIKINDKNICEIEHESYFNEIGFLIQEPVIFDDTIFSNIVLDDESISENDVINALKAVKLWDRVQMLKKSIYSLIGTGGVQLSSGEAQRLCLARLIAKKKSLLILDEPTAALDNYNKNEIFKILDRYKRENNAAILVISHDDSSKKYADEIITIENKKIRVIDKKI